MIGKYGLYSEHYWKWQPASSNFPQAFGELLLMSCSPFASLVVQGCAMRALFVGACSYRAQALGTGARLHLIREKDFWGSSCSRHVFTSSFRAWWSPARFSSISLRYRSSCALSYDAGSSAPRLLRLETGQPAGCLHITFDNDLCASPCKTCVRRSASTSSSDLEAASSCICLGASSCICISFTSLA